MGKVSGVRSSTGREKEEWFALLDDWGAVGREYREIAGWLTEEHEVTKWWAQKIIVEYEQARGVRPAGVRRDGTFEVTASKTVAVPVDRLFEAFVNTRQRKKWLTDGTMSLRTSQSERKARFDWESGPTRVNVDFVDKGGKSAVAVTHGKLPNARQAETTKTKWRERLAELKSVLES
jgi:Domain of unknown function (DUF4287)